MNWIIPLGLGFLGSIHCLSMCGPILMLMRFDGKSKKGIILSLVYHTSRIGVYTLLGGIVGLLMSGINLFNITQIVSLILGGSFILIGVLMLIKKIQFNSSIKSINTKLSGLLQQKNTFKKFIIAGMLNGLLPCGLVYVALSSATLTNHFYQGALYMLIFGIGTFPSMFLTSVFGNWIKKKMNWFNSKKIIGISYFIIGAILLIRGMGLSIPYVSPGINQEKEVNCCHTKK